MRPARVLLLAAPSRPGLASLRACPFAPKPLSLTLTRFTTCPTLPSPPSRLGPPSARPQLGSLSAQREGLRQRATQSDAALQQLAINEGEAMLELQQTRAQVGAPPPCISGAWWVMVHGHQLQLLQSSVIRVVRISRSHEWTCIVCPAFALHCVKGLVYRSAVTALPPRARPCSWRRSARPERGCRRSATSCSAGKAKVAKSRRTAQYKPERLAMQRWIYFAL